MPITITHKKLIDSVGALRELSNLDLDLPTALKVRKILRVSQGDIDDYNAQRKELIEKHAAKDEKGAFVRPINPRTGKPVPEGYDVEANREQFEEDIKTLDKCEVKLDFDPIKPDALGDVKVKSGVLLALDWLIED